MRVGVLLDSELSVGGGFQQAYSVVKLLQKNPLDNVEYVFFVFTHENEKILKDEGLDVVCVNLGVPRFLYRFIKFFKRNKTSFSPLFTERLGAEQEYVEKILDRHSVDLLYFLTHSSFAMGLQRHNFIVTLQDQCHRDWVEFPEVYANLEFERREWICWHTLPKAVAVLVDSELSRRKMHERYGVDLERVHVAPFFPVFSNAATGREPEHLADVREKYSIRLPFLFYPAQLWAHKNHVYILEALRLLRESNVDAAAVFVGKDFGNGAFLKDRAGEMGLEDRVHFLGFVPRPEVVAFYKQALALVMPTYFGPTNIPPLEAFALGCPVCYPDLPGLRDQVADGAFLMDLKEPESLCKIVRVLLYDKQEVERKCLAGIKQLELYSEENYMSVLRRLFDSYSRLLRRHA